MENTKSNFILENNVKISLLIEELVEKVMGDSFDRKFKKYLGHPRRPEIFFRSCVSFDDSKKKIDLKYLQMLANIGRISFYSEIETEDSVYCNNDYSNPNATNKYEIEDECGIAYIGDEKGNSQCVFNFILNEAQNKDFNIHFIQFRKEIDGDPLRRISLVFASYSVIYIHLGLKCKSWIKEIKEIITKFGFKYDETVEDKYEVQITFKP